MQWTAEEIRYLDEHRADGAMAIAEHLGRRVISVQVQASRYGIPLTPRWQRQTNGCLTTNCDKCPNGWS